MRQRDALHRLLDALAEQDLPIDRRVLEGLQATLDPVLRSLLTAPADDEPDDDDFDGGLTEARREVREGQRLTHAEVKRTIDRAAT